jgi:hypothetical protein
VLTVLQGDIRSHNLLEEGLERTLSQLAASP